MSFDILITADTPDGCGVVCCGSPHMIAWLDKLDRVATEDEKLLLSRLMTTESLMFGMDISEISPSEFRQFEALVNRSHEDHQREIDQISDDLFRAFDATFVEVIEALAADKRSSHSVHPPLDPTI